MTKPESSRASEQAKEPNVDLQIPTPPLSGPSAKIRARHVERLAVVYVRQSTLHQVNCHRESTALQYDLARYATAWGWPRDRVLVIDEDLGQSAESAETRPGFQRLLAEVALDHVGLVLGWEMSRLARSCKDWYHLLEVCALSETLLADQDGLYDPTEYNDRLLLGMKGTLSEAEIHLLKGRMEQGRRNKAERGELFGLPPIGYIKLPSGEFALDPDEQVQAVVRLIFEQFDALKSIYLVLKYLVEHGIRIGVRPHDGPNRGNLEWRRPSRSTLANILHHPLYAGAYTYGRGRKGLPRPAIDPAGRRHAGGMLIWDRCPAYITRAQYQKNQHQLAENQSRREARGVPRSGVALLPGLLYCGRCGARMAVYYPNSCRRPQYLCGNDWKIYGEPICQGTSGTVLDEFVGRQVLEALQPSALEVSLTAAEDIEREWQRLHEHWQQRLERARYEADRAARQYRAVEPENRLVGRELERRWEAALQEQRRVEDEYEQFLVQHPTRLTADDREAIRRMAADLPALWNAPSTRPEDRKAIVRQLIERVMVAVRGDSEYLDLTINWVGGMTSRHELVRPVGSFEQLRDHERLLKRIVELRDSGLTARRLAEQLNAEGWNSCGGRGCFTRDVVLCLLRRFGLAGIRPQSRGANAVLRRGEWWASDLARQLGMPAKTLSTWIQRGWVAARRQGKGIRACWIVRAGVKEQERLRKLRRWLHDHHRRSPPEGLTRPISSSHPGG
jgi:DNA invertase Pin-like site-specific DNA recombinase